MSSRFLQQLRSEQHLANIANGRRLYFLIERGGSQLTLKLVMAGIQPNGRLGAPQPYQLQPAHLRQPPPFLESADIELLGALLDSSGDWLKRDSGELPAGIAAGWLEKMLATQRVRGVEGGALQLGEPLRANAYWRLDDAGDQHLEWQCPEGVCVLATEPPSYWDVARGRLGRLVGDVADDAQQWLTKRPRLAAEEVANFIGLRAQEFAGLGLPLPRHIPVRRVLSAPAPQLRLYRVGADSGVKEDRLRLQFRYDVGEVIVFDHVDHRLSRRVYRPASAEVLEVVRDTRAEAALEQALFAALEDYSPEPLEGVEIAFARGGHWRAVMTEVVPKLRRRGWTIEIDSHFHHNFVRAEGVKLAASRLETGWFDLALQVEVNGEVLPLLPLLAECARRYTPAQIASLDAATELPLNLPDGRQLLLPAGRLAQWLSVLVELYDDGAGSETLRMPATQLDRLTSLADVQPSTPECEALLENARQLQAPPDLIHFSLPPTFGADLRDYQRLGVAWLQGRRQLGVGGILADDMGLGKTVQTLAHFSVEKAAGRLQQPALVVAPTSVLHNWAQEADRFAPALRVLVLYGASRHDCWATIGDYDLLLTSYALVVKDIDRWRTLPLSAVVLDEAQAIKNARTQTAREVRKLSADYRICLTGTPLENHLGELWSLFEFLMPGFLDSEERFNRHYRRPIENQADQRRAQSLMQRIAPFMLRRTKVDVAPELPPKTEILIPLPLQGAQQDIYEALRQNAVKDLKARLSDSGDNQGRVLILNALMRLRQACCDPQLIDPELHSAPSAKRDYLLEMLEELVAEGRAVLVFSQFTRMLELIASDLAKRGIPALMLTGKSRDRAALVERFQAGEAPVFLISLKAGGTGLNLTRADTVVHYDPWWNSAAEAQATDRAYRIGQDKPVFVYKLLSEGTVEEKIHALQQHKRDLLQQVYDVAEASTEQLVLDNTALLALLE